VAVLAAAFNFTGLEVEALQHNEKLPLTGSFPNKKTYEFENPFNRAKCEKSSGILCST
jgi:hypothetical protein